MVCGDVRCLSFSSLAAFHVALESCTSLSSSSSALSFVSSRSAPRFDMWGG